MLHPKQDALITTAKKGYRFHSDHPRRKTAFAERVLSRREILMAVAGTACLGTTAGGLAAAEPGGGSGTPIRPAVEKLVRTTASRTVRMKPISTDFKSALVQSIASDPRGKLIAVAGDDHAIRIMDSETLELVSTLTGHSDLIQTLDFDPRGDRLVSAGNDGQVILWNRNAGFEIIQRMQGSPALACVRFSPQGEELAAVGFNEKVYLIGRTRRAGQPVVECECTDLRAVEYRHDGKMLAVAGRSGRLHLFDRPSYQLLGDYHIHNGRIHAIRFTKSSPILVSVGEDGHVAMFDTEQKRIVRRIRVTNGKLFSVSVLDSEHLAVAGSNNVIHLVNVALGRAIERLDDHTGSVSTLASNNDLLFSGGYDATLRRWQLSGLESQRDRIAERVNPLDR